MNVVVEPKVYNTLWTFYKQSMIKYPSLELSKVHEIMDHLGKEMHDFGFYAHIFHRIPYKDDWKQLGYYEFLSGDFHFAYKIEMRINGELFVHIYDVVHSTLNHN